MIEQRNTKIEDLYFQIFKSLDETLSLYNISINILQKYQIFQQQIKETSTEILIKATQFCIHIIDTLLNKQMNSILHNETFQKIEGSWRGLQYLIKNTTSINGVKVKILEINWDALAKDLGFSLDFDQSQIFKKIYNNEFDSPGGEPFGLLIGDYYISHTGRSQDGINHIDTLSAMAKVSAAAFAPFIIAASPNYFELDTFSKMQPWLDLSRTFQQEGYRAVKKLRREEDARFLGVVMPRILMRLPNLFNQKKYNNFVFEEKVISHKDYVWGNAAYCFASIVAKNYGTSGWFNDIRGVEEGNPGKGLVTDLMQQSFDLHRTGLFDMPAVECIVSSNQEKVLAKFGIISLLECKYTPYAAFYSCQSMYQPRTFSLSNANENEIISNKLDHILCVSRFAHYVKIIFRDKIGLFNNPEDCESYLQNWIIKYTAVIDQMSAEQKLKYPLHSAQITVREQIGKPGSYQCTIYLQPHFQMDEIEVKIALNTALGR